MYKLGRAEVYLRLITSTIVTYVVSSIYYQNFSNLASSEYKEKPTHHIHY